MADPRTNLLHGMKEPTPARRIFWLILFFGVSVITILLGNFSLFAAFLFALVAFIAALVYAQGGILLLAACSFFSTIGIYFSQYEWSRRIPYLNAVDAPVVDFIAAFLVVTTLCALMTHITSIPAQRKKLVLHLCLLYGAFLLVGVVASVHAFDYRVFESLYALIRKPAFVFAAYVLLPLVVLRKEEAMQQLFRIWFWVGLFAALFGLSSLVVAQSGDVFRVQPYTFWGITPFGFNHNVLAEVLVTVLPISLYVVLQKQLHEAAWKQRLYQWGTGIIFIASLLTLSRAAWIVVATLAGFVLYHSPEYRKKTSAYWQAYKPILVSIALLLVGYMGFFLVSHTAQSSTASRLLTTDIVSYMVTRSPFIGYGPGMYIPVLEQTRAFTMDFGDPLDAHGYIQKVLLEYGVLGLVLFTACLGYILVFLYKKYRAAEHGEQRLLYQTMFLMAVAAIGFQLFNTSYFSSVMWLPLGVALAVVTKKDN